MNSQPHRVIAPFQKLDVYQASLELAACVHRAEVSDAELRDQVRRASKSVFLNLCEGLPSRSPAMRRRYFDSALGSACEVSGAIDLARAIDAIDADTASQLSSLTDRVGQMLRVLRR